MESPPTPMAKQLRRDEATGPRSQWQDLPGELLQLIQARCRDSGSSQALRLVCRSWRAVPLSHLHPHLLVPLRCSTRPHTPTPAATAPAAKRGSGKAAARGRKRGGGAVAATGAGAGAGPSHGTSPAAAQPALAAAAAPVLAHLGWLYRAFGRSLQTDGQLVLTLTDMWEGGDRRGDRGGAADRKGSSGKGRGAVAAAAAETSQKPLSQVLRRLAASGQQHLRIQHAASSPTAGVVSAPPPGPAASLDCCPSRIGGGACSDSLPTGCSGGGALRAAGYEPGQNAFPAFAAGAASNSFAAAASGAHAGCDQPGCSHCCCCAAAPAPSLRRLRCPGLGALSALRGLRSLELCGVAFGAPLLSRLSGLTQLTRLCSDCPLPVDQLAAAVTALTALAALHVAVTWPTHQPPAQPQAQPQAVRWHELPAQVQQQPPPPPSASTMARERRSRQQRRRSGGSQGTAAAGATPPGGGAGGAVGAAAGGAAGMAADAGADCDDDVDSEDDDGLGVATEDRDTHLELERWRCRRQPGSGGGISSSNSSSSGSSSGSESDGDVVSGLLRAAAMHRAWAPPAAGRSPSYALADEHMAVFMAALAALQRLEDLRLAVSCDGMGRTLLPPPGLLAAARRSCPRLRRFVMRVLSEWQAHGAHKTLYNWVAADTADHSLAAIRHDSAHNHQGVFIWQGLDWSSAAQQQQPQQPLEQQQGQQPGTSAGLLGAVTSPTSPTSPGMSTARLGSTSAPPSASKRGTPAGGGGGGGGRAGASSAPRPFISQSDMGLAGADAAGWEPTPLVVAGPADVSVSLRTSGSSWLGACLAAPAALEAAVRSLPGSHVRGLALQDAAVRGQEPAVGAVGELPDVVLEALAGLQRLAVRGVERRPLRRRRARCGRPESVAGAAVAEAAVAAEVGGSAASPAVAAAAAVPVGRAAGAATAPLATAAGRATAAGTGSGGISSGSGSSSSYSCDYLAQLLQLPSLTSLSLEASCPQWLDVILPLPLPLLQPQPAAAQAAGGETQPQPPGQTQPQLQPQLQHLSLRLRGFHPYELYGQPVDSRSEEEEDEDAEDEGLEHIYCVGRNDKEEEADAEQEEEEGAAGQQGRGGAAGGLALGGGGLWPRCAAAALPRLQLLSGLRTLQLDVPVLLDLSWLPGSLEALQLALATLQLPAAGKTREPKEKEEKPLQAGATGGQALGHAQHQLQRPPLLPRLRRLTALSCHLPPLAALLPAAGCSCLQELALSHCSTLAPLGSAADTPAWRPPRYRGRAGALAPPTLQYRTEDNGPGRGALSTAVRGAASRLRTRRAPPPAAAAAPGSGPAGATRSRARNQGSASMAAAGAASAASVTPAAAAELLEADLAALADVAGSSLAVLCVSCPAAPHDVLSHAGGHDGAAAADVLVRGLRRLPRLQSFCWGVGVGAAGGGGGGGGAGRLRGEEEAQELLLLALAKEAAGDAASSSHSEAVRGQGQGQDPFPRLRMLVLHGGVTSAAALDALVRLGAGCSTSSPATAPSHPGAAAGISGGGSSGGGSGGGGSGGAAAGTTGGGGAAGGARVHVGGGGDVACMGDGAGMGGAGTDSGGGSGGGSGSGGVRGGGWVRRVVQVVGRGRALDEEEEEAAACQLGAEAWMRRLQARLPLCLIKPVLGRDLE